MISNISFGSTYKFSYEKNSARRIQRLKAFYDEMKDAKSVSMRDDLLDEFNSPYAMIKVPSAMDNAFETYCGNMGIRYSKLNKLKEIKDRIKVPDKSLKLAYINFDKLLKIAENQQSDICVCKDGYRLFFKERVDDIINSSSDIIPTYLRIKPGSMSYEDAYKAIKKQGAMNLDKNILLVDFVQKTPALDQCTALALNEAGMKSVPFCMSKDTYKTALKLGIVEE